MAKETDDYVEIESQIDDIIEEKFRDPKLEIKVVAFALRRDYNPIFSLRRECFTIDPYRTLFDIVKINKMIFSRDILLKFVKKNIDEERYDIHKTYIKKIYEESLKNVNVRSIEMLVKKLNELYESRKLMGSINDVITTMDKFDLEKAKTKLQSSIYSNLAIDNKMSGEYLEDWEERREIVLDRKNNPVQYSGVRTGIREFDALSGGLMKGEFGVVIAATGTGKSIALGNFALNAWRFGYNVLFISLEMTKHQIEFRFDSRISKIEHSKFRKGTLDEREMKKWRKKIKGLRERKINFLEVICMSRGCCVNQIREEALKIQSRRKKKIDLIMVDYLNLMNSNENIGQKRDWKQQGEVAWELKDLSMGFNGHGIPIWTANQITDEGMKASKPGTHHLKYSRAIAEVAPVIVALHQSTDDLLQDIMKLWIIKCRDFPKIKKPIVLHPDFNIMMLNRERLSIENGSE